MLSPPMPGTPLIHQNGNGAMSREVPSGTLHSSSPLTRSMASMVAQGGSVQGTPSGDITRPVSTQ